MQLSAKLNNDIVALIERNRALYRKIDENQPGQYANSKSVDDEVNRRRDLCDAAGAEIVANEIELTRLRKEAAAAREAEKNPLPVVSERLQALYDLRDVHIREIVRTRELRADSALAALENGDKKTVKTLDDAFSGYAIAMLELQNVNLAIEQAEVREQEERDEFQRRASDAAFAAAQDVGENKVAAVADDIVLLEAKLAAKYDEFELGLQTLRKTGASFDDARLNVLRSVEIRHRSAKASGLAKALGISIRDAAPLNEAVRMLLRLAIRRPEVKGKAAA